ncbi:MAG: LysR family transcriptional regulator [Rhodocyclaceae bacterium]|nr:LysR family transcriptional regulator [Rhodocyclaceae bacterium]
MDIRRLRYFVVLAEELHFGRAAERLSISQPPLTSAIKMIEDELGIPLFARNSRRVSLTPAGAAFYPQALRVLSQLDFACAAAREVGAGNRGHLLISFVGAMSLRGVPEAVAEFSASHPEIAVSLREMSSFEQLKAILDGDVAGGFLHYSGPLHPDLQYLEISEEAFVCCLPTKHRLADKREIDLAELSAENFIIYAREASPFSYDNVIGVCAAAGFSPIIRHYVTRGVTALLLVARGAGVALVPDAFVNIGLTGISFLGIKGSSIRSMSYFAWRRENINAGLHEFVRTLQK